MEPCEHAGGVWIGQVDRDVKMVEQGHSPRCSEILK